MKTDIFDNAAAVLPDLCFKEPPDLGIVLGSGWGQALKTDEVLFSLPYASIPGLGAATVQGHSGELLMFSRSGKRVVAWCGRRHYYEGLGWESVVMPIEILRRMGCEKVLLTNAAGGINAALQPGDFVILRDHVNLVGVNPLVGEHNPEWGARFPDMTRVYSQHLAELLNAGVNRLDIRAMNGVYAFASGPCYETPAEVRAYKSLGVDVIGMSTVPEAILAHASAMQVAGLSLVSNLAAGISSTSLDHEEVMAAGIAAKPKMAALIDDFIARI